MLSPNVIISRHYLNIATGQAANLLLVQCGDARDIVVHYPPVCYCNAGWTLTASQPRDWHSNGSVIQGTEYHFAMKTFERNGAMIVDDFMILPDGQIARNMDAVEMVASDVRRRYFGAAQIQIMTSEQMPAAERDEAFAALVGAMSNTIVAIRQGDIR
jgi:hypothetical protein